MDRIAAIAEAASKAVISLNKRLVDAEGKIVATDLVLMSMFEVIDKPRLAASIDQ
jgi:hypothetical protein